jgi:hypothetical protein
MGGGCFLLVYHEKFTKSMEKLIAEFFTSISQYLIWDSISTNPLIKNSLAYRLSFFIWHHYQFDELCMSVCDAKNMSLGGNRLEGSEEVAMYSLVGSSTQGQRMKFT